MDSASPRQDSASPRQDSATLADTRGRESRAARRRVLAENGAALVAVAELRDMLDDWVADATAVFSEPDDSCPVCLAECTHEGHHPDSDTIETECCAAAMHRGCLSQYAHAQTRTPHFTEALDDAVAWRARGVHVRFEAVFQRLSDEGLFMPCPLCRATLLSPMARPPQPSEPASASALASTSAPAPSPRPTVSAR